MHEGAQNFLHPRFVLRAIGVTLMIAEASVLTLRQPYAGTFQGNVHISCWKQNLKTSLKPSLVYFALISEGFRSSMKVCQDQIIVVGITLN